MSGLVVQQGPNFKNPIIPSKLWSGGGVAAGGTRNAGHGNWKQVMNPSQRSGFSFDHARAPTGLTSIVGKKVVPRKPTYVPLRENYLKRIADALKTHHQLVQYQAGHGPGATGVATAGAAPPDDSVDSGSTYGLNDLFRTPNTSRRSSSGTSPSIGHSSTRDSSSSEPQSLSSQQSYALSPAQAAQGNLHDKLQEVSYTGAPRYINARTIPSLIHDAQVQGEITPNTTRVISSNRFSANMTDFPTSSSSHADSSDSSYNAEKAAGTLKAQLRSGAKQAMPYVNEGVDTAVGAIAAGGYLGVKGAVGVGSLVVQGVERGYTNAAPILESYLQALPSQTVIIERTQRAFSDEATRLSNASNAAFDYLSNVLTPAPESSRSTPVGRIQPIVDQNAPGVGLPVKSITFQSVPPDLRRRSPRIKQPANIRSEIGDLDPPPPPPPTDSSPSTPPSAMTYNKFRTFHKGKYTQAELSQQWKKYKNK